MRCLSIWEFNSSALIISLADLLKYITHKEMQDEEKTMKLDQTICGDIFLSMPKAGDWPVPGLLLLQNSTYFNNRLGFPGRYLLRNQTYIAQKH